MTGINFGMFIRKITLYYRKFQTSHVGKKDVSVWTSMIPVKDESMVEHFIKHRTIEKLIIRQSNGSIFLMRNSIAYIIIKAAKLAYLQEKKEIS